MINDFLIIKLLIFKTMPKLKKTPAAKSIYLIADKLPDTLHEAAEEFNKAPNTVSLELPAGYIKIKDGPKVKVSVRLEVDQDTLTSARYTKTKTVQA